MKLIAVMLLSLCPLSSCLYRQYYFVNMNMSWTDAQSYCRQNYTDLATIDSTEEMTRLISSVHTGYTGAAWIGLYNDVNSWRWSLDGSRLYGKGRTLYTNWYPGEPNNLHGIETCAVMYKLGTWADVPCGGVLYTIHFVCYDETLQKYYLNTSDVSVKTWSDAQSYCRKYYTDLASMRNQNENKLIQERVPDDYRVWIGLYRDGWKWSNGENATFLSWQTGKPDNALGNENCAAQYLSEEQKWSDAPCNEKHPFVCYEDNLVLVQENKSWSEALTYCRNEKMDLVSVSTENIQNWVERRVKNATSTHVWLGLRFTCTLSFWFWVDREPLWYTNWAPGNGTGDGECDHTGAVEAGGGHLWVSRPESDRLNFICAKCTV